MLPYKEKVELSEFPVKYFVSRSSENKLIEAHPHWHSAIEILYVVSGKANQQLGENIVKIEKGDIVIIWSNQFHSTCSVIKDYCEIAVLQFNADMFIQPFLNSELSDVQNLYFYDKIKTTSEIGNYLFDVLNQIITELKQKKEGCWFKICGAIYLLIGEILRNKSLLPICQEKSYSEYDRVTALRIFKYIEENYKYDISLRRIADDTGFSVTHFSRIFKKVSGMTFKQYLNYYRVNKAVSYLENGESVTEASMKSGFADINTFIRNFKKYKGLVPSKYKR